MALEKFKFTDYYKTDLAILRALGAAIIESGNTNKKLWYIYIFVVNFGFTFLGNMTEIIHLFEIESITKLAASGYVISSTLLANIKPLFLFINRKKVLTLIDMLDEHLFLPDSEEQVHIAKQSLRFYRITKITIDTISSISVVACMTSPLIYFHERRLPFPAWYPFDIRPITTFFFIYIHQCITVFYVSFMNVYTDIMFAGMNTFIGIQCDLLCHKLNNIKEERFGEDLINHIKHHKLILR